jgi:hypothetical protein
MASDNINELGGGWALGNLNGLNSGGGRAGLRSPISRNHFGKTARGR